MIGDEWDRENDVLECYICLSRILCQHRDR